MRTFSRTFFLEAMFAPARQPLDDAGQAALVQGNRRSEQVGIPRTVRFKKNQETPSEEECLVWDHRDMSVASCAQTTVEVAALMVK